MKPFKVVAVAMGLLVSISCSQQIPESEIPSVVLNTVELEFSNVTNVEWEKKGTIYAVEFEINNREHDALIEETGDLIKFIKEVSLEELPEMLKTTVSSKEKLQKVDDIHLLTIGEASYYQFEFEGTLTSLTKVYNLEGEEMQEINYYD